MSILNVIEIVKGMLLALKGHDRVTLEHILLRRHMNSPSKLLHWPATYFVDLIILYRFCLLSLLLLSTTQKHPYSMTDSNAVCLLSLIKNHALAYQASGRPSVVALESKGDHDEEQKWAIETGDEPNTVAIKYLADGKYLHAEPRKYGKVGTGDKQWWKLLPGGDEGFIRPLSSCRLQVVGEPEWFLYNCNERTSRIKPGGGERNEVYMKGYSVCSQLISQYSS